MGSTTGTRMIDVHPTNRDALRAWDGGDGTYWADNDTMFDASLKHYHRQFLDAADIRPGERVLDVGCGSGQITREAARLAGNAAGCGKSAGSAVGVDLSAELLDKARRRAAEKNVHNARFVQADAQIHPFAPTSFDVVVSRTGTMFFGDPVAAFTNLRNALREGGRLAMLVWQPVATNRWFVEFTQTVTGSPEIPAPPADAPGPFAFADPRRSHDVLGAAGLRDILVEGAVEPMYFGANPAEAYRFIDEFGYVKYLLGRYDGDEAGRARAIEALHASIDAHATDAGVLYPSAAWIVTARR